MYNTQTSVAIKSTFHIYMNTTITPSKTRINFNYAPKSVYIKSQSCLLYYDLYTDNCAWYNSVDETNRVCYFINSPSFQRSLNEPLKLPARFSYFDV